MVDKNAPINESSHDEEEEDDHAFIRRNLYKGGIALGILIGLMFLVGLLFDTHLTELSEFLAGHTEWYTILAIVFAIDFFITPFPPDMLLVLLTKTGSMQDKLEVAMIFGVASTLAGYSAWTFARFFVKPEWFGSTFTGFLKKHHKRINRLGKWMVTLGALTPLPYSLTCWAAGFLKMDFKVFVIFASLRLFRFVLYFLVIHMSQGLGQTLRDLF